MEHTFESLAKANTKTLENIMKEGTMPDIRKMTGWEFNGYNLTFMADILGIRKFRKGFYKEGDMFKGYNVKMKQNKFKYPWEYKNEKPERFGWFDIMSVSVFALKENRKVLYPNALILHYGLDKRNNLFEGKMLRDFLVQVNENDKDLYLGKAHNAIGKKLVMPSYFILKRAEEINL